MTRTLDLSKDFTTIVDFQETVTFFSRTGETTVARPIKITNALRRKREAGTTSEGTELEMRRVRFMARHDLQLNFTVWLLPSSQLQGEVPTRGDLIVDAAGVNWLVKYVETNQQQIGTFRCGCNDVKGDG